MSQQSQFPYSVEQLPTGAWSSNAGTPLLTPTGSTFPTPYGSVRGCGPYAPLGSIPPSPLLGSPSIGCSAAPSPYGSIRSAPELFPTLPGTPMISSGLPSPCIPATPMCSPMPSSMPTPIPSAMPSPFPSAVPSANPTPMGSMRGMPDGLVDPPPGYVTANTSQQNLLVHPPRYGSFLPSPAYIKNRREDFAVQNEAYHRRRLGIVEEVFDGPRPEFWRHGLSDSIRLRNWQATRRILENNDDDEDEEWKPSPRCRCVIL